MNDFKQKIINLLQRFDIEFWTAGKNVSRDSINVRCPYCHDHSNHLGIFIDTMLFHCWRCERKGHLARLLATKTGLPVSTCEDLCKQDETLQTRSALDRIKAIVNKIKISEQQTPEKIVKQIDLPEHSHLLNYKFYESDDTFAELLYRFLTRRRFTIDDCIYHYCHICTGGDFSHRLIIPTLFDGKIVSYQGADMTGKAHLKYKMSSNEINSYLYGYDDIQPNSDIILVEGVFDAWRLHENTVATFGTHLTKEQLGLLISLKPRNVILCWDGDAYFKSRKIRSQLEERVGVPVHCIPLPKNEDPDSYDRNKTLDLVKTKLERS